MANFFSPSLVLLLVLFQLSQANSDVSSSCINCICGVESNGNQPGCGVVKGDVPCGSGCVMDVGSCSCGPFQIKKPYFTDCSSYVSLPKKEWKECSTDVTCAKKCVEAYLNHYGYYCTKSTSITCEQYGGIHNGGPKGCDSPRTIGYRKKITKCCGGGYCGSGNHTNEW